MLQKIIERINGNCDGWGSRKHKTLRRNHKYAGAFSTPVYASELAQKIGYNNLLGWYICCDEVKFGENCLKGGFFLARQGFSPVLACSDDRFWLGRSLVRGFWHINRPA